MGCKVCKSTHRKFYEEARRVKSYKYHGLAIIAARYYGERIRAREFKRHFEAGHGGV